MTDPNKDPGFLNQVSCIIPQVTNAVLNAVGFEDAESRKRRQNELPRSSARSIGRVAHGMR